MNYTPPYQPHPSKVSPQGCISIIGMAAAGKTTIGRELACLIGWPQLDADNLIEATYASRLQGIADTLTKEDFLDIESLVIQGSSVCRIIFSTGGSAVYRQETIDYLRSKGPIIYINVPLPIILERIARKPDRGLAISEGQTIEDLYNERAALYSRAATYTVDGGYAPAKTYAEEVAKWLTEPA